MRRTQGLTVGISMLVGVVLLGALPAGAALHAPQEEPTASVKLKKCKDVPDARCGSVTVPLDRANPGGKTIDIHFELYPHRNRSRPPLEPIVAVEGGPGYSTRASRDYYVDIFDPLMNRRDLLLVDNRGTGESGLIRCKKLQSYQSDFTQNAAACARKLGDNADDYGSGNAVEDMVAVLDALDIGQVNLYGDSYGTYFGQTFGLRHPERLRSLILDAAYPVVGSDPWYRDSVRAMRNAYRVACSRAPSCASVGGDPIDRLGAMAAKLREAPITGKAKDADGGEQTVKLDAPALAYVAWAASGVPTIYRELDPAIRAALRPTDPDYQPLLRLAAENIVLEAGDAVDYSEGLYASVICHDYVELWNPTAPIADREAQFQASKAALDRDDPQAFAPFTNAEWIAQPYNEFDYCLQWPAPSVPDPPKPAGATFPRVPTLVLASDLDSNTSPEGGEVVAKQFGAEFVTSVNYTHVSAQGDFGRCASRIVVRFVRTLDVGDTSCSKEYNENRIVESFATKSSELPGTADEQVVTAMVATAGDVIARWWSMYGYDGVGLRGGTFKTSGDTTVRFKLKNVKWVEDLPVSGTIVQHRDTGDITAKLRSGPADDPKAQLTITWNDWTPLAQAQVQGTVDGNPVDVEIPAP